MAKSITAASNMSSNAADRALITKLQTNVVDFALNSAGLAIKTTGSALAKSVNTVYAMLDGVLFSKAAADMAALSGTVTNAKFNVFAFTLKADGTLATTMGTEGATLAAVVFPTIPASSVVLGFLIVNPTGTGNFVGGTTALDDATVVPNAVYVNTPFPFNPNALSL